MPTSFSEPAGLWSRLMGSLTGRRPVPEPLAPPLFRARPVPPPEPRGPGLPPLDEILLEAPPAPDPERAPRPTLVREPPALSATAHVSGGGEPPATARPAAPPVQAGPLPTPVERRALERIRVLIGSGIVAEAQTLLDMHFRDHPELLDRAGLPIYLIESYRIAAVKGDAQAMAALGALLRPRLADSDPLLEAIAARGATRIRHLPAARAAWQAALVRAPGLTEARDWLARNPATPEAGLLAAELVLPATDAADAVRLPAAPPPAAPAPLPPALPAGAPARLALHAVVRLEGGRPGVVAGDAAAWDGAREIAGALPGEVAVVLCGPPPPVRSLAFTELALTLYAICHATEPRLRPARLYVGREPWALRPVADSPAELLALLFPGLRVVGGFEGAVREPAALLLEPGLRNAATGTLCGGMMPQMARWTQAARAEVFAAYGLPGQERPLRVPGRRPQALYLQPTPARALADPARDTLLTLLGRAGFEAATLDLATLSWRAQVRSIHGADLLVGVHGPALAGVAWAHPQARVMELFPPGVRRYDTQLLAEAAGMIYLAIEGAAHGGFVGKPRERFGPPRGGQGGIVTDLPWPLLETALLGPAPG